MNTSRFILAAIAAFVFTFAFDFLVHGYLLTDLYIQTASLWRGESDYKMHAMILSQIAFAIMIAFIYTRNYEGKGVGEGLRYGLLMGLFLASVEIGTYSYMPVPLVLPMAWVGASIVKGLGCGLIISLTYKN